jgi:signal transduction histidine kinase
MNFLIYSYIYNRYYHYNAKNNITGPEQLVSYCFFNKENKVKRMADQTAEAYRKQLEMRIAELDKLNAELVELKSLEKFALTGRISRTIAHEVRNPLTNINLALEQLKVDLKDNEDSKMFLDMIARNSDRINQLITDLLNSTRANLLVFDKRKIIELLDESIEYAQDRIDLKEIKVVKEYNANCVVSVDVQKIRIAFLNLIVNAIEAMGKGKGILTLKTELNNDRCIVTISDNGKGIEPENISRLFEPYFTTKENGTGLGLTNTQNIILSHKASIFVKSELGKGTSFMISFKVE